MDVRSTGSLSAPVLALGIFLAERRGALPPSWLKPSRQAPEFPTLIGPPRGFRWQQVSEPRWKDKHRDLVGLSKSHERSTGVLNPY
jgi:hypothetical protein